MTYRYYDSGWSSYNGGCPVGTRIQDKHSGGDRTLTETIPDHSYSLTEKSIFISPAGQRVFRLFGTVSQMAGFCLPRPTFSYNPNVFNNITNKVFSEIKGHDFNSGVFLAELPQNVKLIGEKANAFRRAYKAWQRNDFQGMFKALSGHKHSFEGRVSNNYLEWTYGILPLLRDVYEACKFINKHANPVKTQSFRVGIVDKPPPNVSTPFLYWKKAEGQMKAQMIVKSVEQLPLQVDLGLDDPYSVLWEKLPYSFVVDWFLPIGPWLQALNASRRMKFDYAIYSNFIIEDFSGPRNSDVVYDYIGMDSTYYHKATGSRHIYTSLAGMPTLPGFNPMQKALSLGHTVNALALLANLHHR